MGWLSCLVHEFLERILYLLPFDKYVCISKSTQKQLLDIGIKQNKTKVVYPGIDYQHWNFKKYNKKMIKEKLGLKNNFVYVFTGRPGTSKGLEYLIKAVPIISEKIPNSKLFAIVSKNLAYKKNYDSIMKLIKKLKIKNRVILHDPVSYKELPSYVNIADCVVIPSLAEGFGFVAVEACAMGKSVVASNTTSLPEVISGKYVLVKPKSPKAIAKGVEMVFNKKTMQSKLKQFLNKESIKNYLNIYKEKIK